MTVLGPPTAILENTSSTPALMIRVNVVGEKDGEQFLPVFYSDNYFSLLPGEKKEINIPLERCRYERRDPEGGYLRL